MNPLSPARWAMGAALGVLVVLAAAPAESVAAVPAAPALASGVGVCTQDYPPRPIGIRIGTGVVVAGGTVSVTGEGFAPGTGVILELEPGSRLLARLLTGPQGGFSVRVTIPSDTPAADYSIVAVGRCSGDSQKLRLTAQLMVTGPEVPPRANGPTPGPARLAFTGAQSVAVVAGCLVLLTVGSALVLLSRRRRLAGGTVRDQVDPT